MNAKMIKVSGYTHNLLKKIKALSDHQEKRESLGSIVDRLVDNEYKRIEKQ